MYFMKTVHAWRKKKKMKNLVHSWSMFIFSCRDNLWSQRTFLVLFHLDSAAVSTDAPPIWLREAHLFSLSKGGFYFFNPNMWSNVYIETCNVLPAAVQMMLIIWKCTLPGCKWTSKRMHSHYLATAGKVWSVFAFRTLIETLWSAKRGGWITGLKIQE